MTPLTRSDRLTAREQQVLRLVWNGWTTTRIANALAIGKRRVEMHRSQIMLKLGARNLAHMLRLALEHGLITNE